MINIRILIGWTLSAMLLATLGCEQRSPGRSADEITGPPVTVRSQCKNFNEQRNPFFGDLHVHTTYSLDANTQDTRTTPYQAYEFALGNELGVQPFTAAAEDGGEPTRFIQLRRPLDFAAVTDHVELFGETEICTNQEDYPVEYNSPDCMFYRESPENAFLYFNFVQLGLPLMMAPDVLQGIPGADQIPAAGAGGNVPRLAFCGPNGETCLEAAKTPWRDLQVAAETYYDRTDECSFTTFVAYEYTGAPRSFNLHRNVIFRSEVVPEQPPAYQEHTTPQKLWQALSDRCVNADGCDYLTIPHNSNLSGGMMFDVPADSETSAEYAATRQFNEPLAEVYQHKGQSECLNTMGAGMQDELCGFEIVPYDNLSGNRFGGANAGPPKEQDYLREVLKEGLRREEQVGVNPFKYGLIGSSDTHLGSPGLTLEKAGITRDDPSYPGHGGASTAGGGEGLVDEIEYSPGGLAVLWAEENTRESLYAALRRREAYATSGTRPIVRFFGSWDLPTDLCSQTDLVGTGYAQGVPMGGDLPDQPANATSPVFVLSALRDPGVDGSNAEPLQRMQIIKGWVENGEKKEVVIDIAGDSNNGASVDTDSCETSGPGEASLCAVWQDPDFDPAEHAMYYGRVVENPSCRWSARQCNAAGWDSQGCSAGTPPAGFAECCTDNFPRDIQERAWTSPIWYRPTPQ